MLSAHASCQQRETITAGGRAHYLLGSQLCSTGVSSTRAAGPHICWHQGIKLSIAACSDQSSCYVCINYKWLWVCVWVCKGRLPPSAQFCSQWSVAVGMLQWAEQGIYLKQSLQSHFFAALGRKSEFPCKEHFSECVTWSLIAGPWTCQITKLIDFECLSIDLSMCICMCTYICMCVFAFSRNRSRWSSYEHNTTEMKLL